MDKLKRNFYNLSISHTLLIFTIGFTTIASFMVECERTFFQNMQYNIAFKYLDTVSGFNKLIIWNSNTSINLSKLDSFYMWLLEILIWIIPPLTYILSGILCTITFYKLKMQHPLETLNSCAINIANNNLDFTICHQQEDELGKLCMAFSKMKDELHSNTTEMWRQAEDRKRLNSVFSHDLKTPLTILKGDIDILRKYSPQGKLSSKEVLEMYCSMSEQVTRLQNFVYSMNTLQKIEDIKIHKSSTNTQEFLNKLENEANSIANGYSIIWEKDLSTPSLFIDSEIVLEVYENILSNAIRYANHSISILVNVTDSNLKIQIQDDGAGFDSKSIKLATNPFYTTEPSRTTSLHYGLGLNICKILCERHGGNISIANAEPGGAKITVTFSIL